MFSGLEVPVPERISYRVHSWANGQTFIARGGHYVWHDGLVYDAARRSSLSPDMFTQGWWVTPEDAREFYDAWVVGKVVPFVSTGPEDW